MRGLRKSRRIATTTFNVSSSIPVYSQSSFVCQSSSNYSLRNSITEIYQPSIENSSLNFVPSPSRSIFKRFYATSIPGSPSAPTEPSKPTNTYATLSTDPTKIRNIAIIAHVDHGKTSMVDMLLVHSGTLAAHEKSARGDRVMDSNAQEQERGITIVAKQTSVEYKDHLINIVDTPGHGDFGGEVERILTMIDGAILLVDASEGVMPQTKFVLGKALQRGLRVIVCLNKMDKPSIRPDEVKLRSLTSSLHSMPQTSNLTTQLSIPLLAMAGQYPILTMTEKIPSTQF